ncbi:hypothetical protein [Bradyrhizobium commune]|uniref:Uncharacterized protein n=1 Tax=Bradyrhizobium commune TaxID=83627 RepID=A0A7S9DAS2_9BRAD|nr:hypothetical protein [Bradyrhizobium commune]QPF94367.1 hypothetical protein IC761_14300 [Bradyrhizobium commune]
MTRDALSAPISCAQSAQAACSLGIDSESFQNLFTTSRIDCRNLYGDEVREALFIFHRRADGFTSWERTRRELQRSVTMKSSESASPPVLPTGNRDYDRWIICGYAMFSVVMIAAIYFAVPGADATDATTALAMALP